MINFRNLSFHEAQIIFGKVKPIFQLIELVQFNKLTFAKHLKSLKEFTLLLVGTHIRTSVWGKLCRDIVTYTPR